MAKKSTVKNEPEVVVMGEEVSHNNSNPGSVVWGTFVLFAGVVLLLNTTNILPWNVWEMIFSFWPVFIILIGINILLGNNIVSRTVSALLSLSVFSMIFIIIMESTTPGFADNLPESVKLIVNNFSNLQK